MSPLVLAHRGGAKMLYNLKLENTISAFERAVALGCTWIETDVRASKDGVVYVIHDEDLRRLAGAHYRIEDTDSSVLDRVRIGGREPMPRLSEVLRRFSGVNFNIDIKSDQAVAPLIRLLRSAGHGAQIRLASFDTDRLVRVREALPGARTSISRNELARLLLLGTPPASMSYPNIDAAQIPLHWHGVPIATRAVIGRLHRMDLAVHVWTVDEEPQMRRLIAYGVDGLITGRPDLAMKVIAQSAHSGRR